MPSSTVKFLLKADEKIIIHWLIFKKLNPIWWGFFCFVLLALIFLNIKAVQKYKEPDYVILTHSESHQLHAVPTEFNYATCEVRYFSA